MLDVLEEAVSPRRCGTSSRSRTPPSSTRDQSVRSGGIDLWVACARVADALPAELSELAVPLLRGPLRHRPPADAGADPPAALSRRTSLPKLLPIVLGWVVTYAEKADPDALERAIWALRCLAPGHPRTSRRSPAGTASPWLTSAECQRIRPRAAAHRVVARRAPRSPGLDEGGAGHGRQPGADRLLQPAPRAPAPGADGPAAAAGGRAAGRDRAAQRHPRRRAPVACPGTGRAVAVGRPVGRRGAVARSVEDRQPPGEEGAPGRRLAGAIARGAELAQALAEGHLPPPS